MPTLSADPIATRTRPTEADQLATRNRESNLAALARRQPSLTETLRDVAPGVSWIFGRDGYLTAMEPGERWYAGCSVPLLAGRAVLKSFEAGTGVACFLNPTHAAQVRVVLDTLAPNQALICVTPDTRSLDVAIHCDDFTAAIDAGRLWFVTGDQWTDALSRLLDETPGLPTPSRFVRLPHADAAIIEQLIGDAQRVFADITSRRSTVIAELRSNGAPGPGDELCVIAPSMFRLWDDAGAALAGVVGNVSPFDPDAPAGCSPLALAKVASTSRAVVAANLSRAEIGSALPNQLPLLTWITTPSVPSHESAGPNDGLLVADPTWRDTALARGWPADRVHLAGWPTRDLGAAAGAARVAIIADTVSIEPPKSLEEFSSHCLLWETIRTAIANDPFVVPADSVDWLHEQAQAHGIAPETLDTTLFVQHLIVPAYQQAIARNLIAQHIPLAIHGSGWQKLPEFAEVAAGPITSRDDLETAARDASALVHVWPDTSAHPIDALGRPVVRRSSRRIDSFVRDVRNATSKRQAIPELSAELVTSVLSRLERGGGAG